LRRKGGNERGRAKRGCTGEKIEEEREEKTGSVGWTKKGSRVWTARFGRESEGELFGRATYR